MALFGMIEPGYALAGVLVGFLVGQTGVGGGSLMTPLLILLFRIHPVTAVGTDLLFAAITKSVGTLVHGAHGTVDWRITVRLAMGSVPATLLTLLIASRLQMTGHGASSLIGGLLGTMLILTGIALLYQRRIARLLAPLMARIPERGIVLMTVLTGAVLGSLVSLTSVGAGAIGVTVLLLLYPTLSPARIVGSDLAHAVPLTLVAGAGHWWLGSVDVPLLVSLLIGSIPGIALGSHLAARVPEWVLRPLMAIVLSLIGIRLVL
jgi:uncharacterized membrane protein YfcA